jgi:hypothetical protein
MLKEPTVQEITTQYVRDILGPIPKEDFIEGLFTNGQSKCCVMGHWKRLHSPNPDNFDISNCSDIKLGWDMSSNLRKWSKHMAQMMDTLQLVDTNNTESKSFPQDNPKDRVMAWLDKVDEYLNSNPEVPQPSQV